MNPTLARWLFVAGAATSVACGVRAGNDVLIPMDFEGWVVIHYGVAGAPALGRTGFRRVIAVPASGSMSTSSERPDGYGIDRYYFVDAKGQRTVIEQGMQSCRGPQNACAQQFEYGTRPTVVTLFFVGPNSALRHHPRPTLP